jgi:alkylation response protein AidB-like acyl-CoA dehydrogenase
MFAEAIEDILTRYCTTEHVRQIEGGASSRPLAQAIADAGFHELLAAEEDGGGDAGWRDFHDIVVLCGAYALPLPLPQTMAVRALSSNHGDVPAGLITIAPLLCRDGDGGVTAAATPYARSADHVIGWLDDRLVVLAVEGAHLTPTGVHGSMTASLRWADAGALRPLPSNVSAQGLQAIAALLHAGLIAGAMKRAFDLTMGYANDRIQFGKPIGKFQAIQHQLAVMAEQVVAARIAVEMAFNVEDGTPDVPACAVAKGRASEAAQQVATIAHAVHGAIGITEEYDLQLYTRRLHEWRMAHGSENHWHRLIGSLMLDSREPLAADFVRSLC